MERLVKISFEELVTDHLWGYGPVVAIGDPRAKCKATLGCGSGLDRYRLAGTGDGLDAAGFDDCGGRGRNARVCLGN